VRRARQGRGGVGGEGQSLVYFTGTNEEVYRPDILDEEPPDEEEEQKKEGKTHQVLQAPQTKPLSILQMILQPSRGRNDDMRFLRQSDLLSHRVHSSNDGGDADTDRGTEGGEGVGDLVGELTK
jgi:hypothetical protein